MFRILVVDDDAPINDLLTETLRGNPTYEVDSALSGHAALEYVRHTTPDLIVLDLMMPPPDGVAVYAALQADPVTASIRVLFATANPGSLSRLQANTAIHALLKPFQLATLEETVHLLLYGERGEHHGQ